MLTQEQINTFRLALAAQNRYDETDASKLDPDDVASLSEIVGTRDSLADFGRVTALRLDRTICGDLYVGRVRGGRTLSVMDFGDVRGSYIA